MKIDAVVIEDEYKIREVFIELLENFCPLIQVVGQTDNINDGYNLILSKKPKVVFLDIEMPGGNGFELLSKFEKINFETIFVSSYGHYAIRAIKSCALDYLLKPVIIEDLQEVTKRLQEKIELKDNALKYRILQENLISTDCPQKLIITTKNKLEYINTNEITHLMGDGNYTYIYLQNNDKFYVAKTLKDYEYVLCELSSNFMRVHKTFIVNTSYIHHIERGDEYLAILKNNVRVEVSRRKKQELMNKLFK